MVIVMGSLTGVLSSSYLLAEVDYYYVFAICALVAFIALLFVLVYVRESVEVAESEVSILSTLAMRLQCTLPFFRVGFAISSPHLTSKTCSILSLNQESKT